MSAANALNAFMASQGYRQDQEDRQRAAQERQRAIGLDNTRGKINALMMQPELGAVGGRLPASNISAEEITSAARGAGMAENNPSLNRVVDGINQGLSPDQAAQRAAQGAGQRQASRADQMRQLAIGSADPEIMSQVQQALAGMSAQEQQDAARRLRGQRAAALTLLDMPEADRALWVRQNRPTIESVGLTVEQVLSQPLNDQNLTAHVRMAQGLDDELFAGITGPQTLGESDTRVDMLSGRQAIGQAGSEARALESRGLDISQQNANTSRMNADTSRMEAEGQSGPDYGEINELYNSAEGALGDFRDIEDAYARVQASISQPSAAGDLALIFNFMKMLDPGSTVREGEFATAQNAAGVPDRARAAYNNIVNGQRMTPEQRSDFSGRAAQLYQAQRGLAEQRLSRFQEQADARQFPREQAIPRFADFGGRPAPAPQPDAEPSIDDLIRRYGG